jgi:hypothetical protein
MQDGGGLCSQSILLPEKRTVHPNRQELVLTLDWAMKRIETWGADAGRNPICKMACNKFDESPLQRKFDDPRKEWASTAKAAWGVTPWRTGQVMDFELVYATATHLKDVDAEAFLITMEGAPPGVKEDLPRTPAFFPEKTKWRLDPEESASYWWVKFSSLLHRITLTLCSPGLRWLPRFADDFMTLSRGRELWAPLLRVLLLREIFKLLALELGLAASRLEWPCRWAQKLCGNGKVLVRGFRSGLGRLNFMTIVYRHLRPSLGPMFGWVATLPEGAAVTWPVAIKPALKRIASRLEAMPAFRMREKRPGAGERFRADPKLMTTTFPLTWILLKFAACTHE